MVFRKDNIFYEKKTPSYIHIYIEKHVYYIGRIWKLQPKNEEKHKIIKRNMTV